MSDPQSIFDLRLVKSKQWTVATAEQLFSVRPKQGTDLADVQQEIGKLNDYLRIFAYTDGNTCPGCGSTLSGLFGTFEWEIVHGEGQCRKCRYPCRAYHRPKTGPIKFFSAVLPYHPDGLQAKDQEVPA